MLFNRVVVSVGEEMKVTDDIKSWWSFLSRQGEMLTHALLQICKKMSARKEVFKGGSIRNSSLKHTHTQRTNIVQP